MEYDLLPHEFFPLPDGGKLRFACFEPSEPARATVLAIPGRREFIEKKYAELGPSLVNNAVRLIIVEPRGQGLSSRFLDGPARQRDHAVSFQTHLDDLRAFYAHEIENEITTPLFLHGHSMGAHLLLRFLSEDQPQVAGAFVTAPMLALSSLPAHMMAHGLSWLGVNVLDKAADYIPLMHDFDDSDCVFDNNPLTNDAERFRIMGDYFAAHPQLAVGGVTWGWAAAAFESMQMMRMWPYMNRISTPLLALVGGDDTVTPATDTVPLLNQIPGMRLGLLPAARHDILNETLTTRAKAWQMINDFIDAQIAASLTQAKTA